MRRFEHAARRGMGRLFAVVLPVLTILAALAGVLLEAVPAVLLAVLLGLAGTAFVLTVVSARARAIADRVDRAARGDVSTERIFEQQDEWRELAEAIDRMATSLRLRRINSWRNASAPNVSWRTCHPLWSCSRTAGWSTTTVPRRSCSRSPPTPSALTLRRSDPTRSSMPPRRPA
jgi:HAMP domain-containing protein